MAELASQSGAEHFTTTMHRMFSENLTYGGDPGPGATDWWASFNSPGNRDSPLDANTRAYRLVAPTGWYIAAATHASLELTEPVEDVMNLSFDFRTAAGTPPGTVTGGSPRLVAILNSGNAVFMDAVNCQQPITVSGGTWARMDATGATTDDGPCTIYDYTLPYTNTPTMSAWDVFAAANPGDFVIYTFFVVDQPGTYVHRPDHLRHGADLHLLEDSGTAVPHRGCVLTAEGQTN